MSNQFIFDLVADMGTTLGGEAIHFKYDGYAIQALGEEMWVVGTTESNDTYPTLELNSPKILFDLLLTVKGPLPAARNEAVLGDHISSAKILEWCEKYGLLFNEAEASPDGFRLRRAWFEIASLYSKFKVWEGLISEDIDLIRANLPRDQRLKTLSLVIPSLREKYLDLAAVKGPNHLSTIKAKNQLDAVILEKGGLERNDRVDDIAETAIKTAKEAAEEAVKEVAKEAKITATKTEIEAAKKAAEEAAVIATAKDYLTQNSIVKSSSVLDLSGTHPRIKHYFNSLLDICRYQLNLLMTTEGADASKHLKECRNPDCRALFWAKHGNERLCDSCNPRSTDGRKSKQGSKQLYERNRPPRKPRSRKGEDQ